MLIKGDFNLLFKKFNSKEYRLNRLYKRYNYVTNKNLNNKFIKLNKFNFNTIFLSLYRSYVFSKNFYSKKSNKKRHRYSVNRRFYLENPNSNNYIFNMYKKFYSRKSTNKNKSNMDKKFYSKKSINNNYMFNVNKKYFKIRKKNYKIRNFFFYNLNNNYFNKYNDSTTIASLRKKWGSLDNNKFMYYRSRVFKKYNLIKYKFFRKNNRRRRSWLKKVYFNHNVMSMLRKDRNSLNIYFNLNFFYQKPLTRFILNFKKNSIKNIINFLYLRIINIIYLSKILINFKDIDNLFNRRLVYINGIIIRDPRYIANQYDIISFKISWNFYKFLIYNRLKFLFLNNYNKSYMDSCSDFVFKRYKSFFF